MNRTLTVAALGLLLLASPASATTVGLEASASYDRGSPSQFVSGSVLDESERIFGSGPISLQVGFIVDAFDGAPDVSDVVGTVEWSGGVGGSATLNAGGFAGGSAFARDLVFALDAPFVDGGTSVSAFGVRLGVAENWFAATPEQRLALFLAGTIVSVYPSLDLGSSGGPVFFEVDPVGGVSMSPVPAPAAGLLLAAALCALTAPSRLRAGRRAKAATDRAAGSGRRAERDETRETSR